MLQNSAFFSLIILFTVLSCSSNDVQTDNRSMGHKNIEILRPAKRKMSKRERMVLRYKLMRLNRKRYDPIWKVREYDSIVRERKARKRKVKQYSSPPPMEIIKQSTRFEIVQEVNQRMTYYCFTKKGQRKHGGEEDCTEYTRNLYNDCIKNEQRAFDSGRRFGFLYCVKSGIK